MKTHCRYLIPLLSLAALLPVCRAVPFRRFAVLLLPTIVHALFCLTLVGHLLTFTAGRWQRFPLAPGQAVALPDLGVSFDVELGQGAVRLTDRAGEKLELSFLHPARYAGRSFLLTMQPKKLRADQNRPPPLELLVVSDPGFRLLMAVWALVVASLLAYFGLGRAAG